MKRIVVEGSPEQIGKLMKALIGLNVETLRFREDLQTENLWSIHDVKSLYDCTDEQALHILHKALTNDATMEQIWYAIKERAEMEGLEEKEK
jgi:hypothetical protein